MNNYCLVLPEKLKVNEVEEIKNSLDFADIESEFEIDPSQVNSIDTVGIQFLVSLIAKINKVGLKIAWKSDNQLIIDTAEILGLVDKLR